VLTLLGRTDDLRECFRSSLTGRTRLDDLREAVLQAMLFAGYPRAIHALEVLAEVLAGRRASPPAKPEFPTGRAPGNGYFLARGEALFEKVYGESTAPVRERIAGFHPDLMDWILADAYGKVLARPGLSLKTRELLSVALLTALGLPRQLAAHVRGALRAGARRSGLREAIEEIALFVPAANLRMARERLARETDGR
jgi:4-carboxymuconolactone decarboxylase